MSFSRNAGPSAWDFQQLWCDVLGKATRSRAGYATKAKGQRNYGRSHCYWCDGQDGPEPLWKCNWTAPKSWVKRWTPKAPSHISSFKTVSGVMSKSWGDSWSMSISVRRFQRPTFGQIVRPYSDLTRARHLQFYLKCHLNLTRHWARSRFSCHFGGSWSIDPNWPEVSFQDFKRALETVQNESQVQDEDRKQPIFWINWKQNLDLNMINPIPQYQPPNLVP